MSFGKWVLIGATFIAIAGALLWMHSRGASLNLDALNLFFVVTTILSLAFNLYQFMQERHRHGPLRNALISLSNGLKAKQLRYHEAQSNVVALTKSGANINVLAVELYDSIREILHDLEELREHVVGAVLTLDPNASEAVFRASEFGLNDQEKQFRREGMDRAIQRQREASMARPPVVQQEVTTQAASTSPTSA